jgi:hypothetical protein
MAAFKDLTGKKFGRLTVIKRDYNTIYKNDTYWLCKCDCGKEVSVCRGNLKSGNTRSCGCLHSEIISKILRKNNKYNLSGEYGIGWTNNTNNEFYFDLNQYDKIKDYYWWENDQGYILGRRNSKDKVIRMHRLIMDIIEDKTIDIDHKDLNRNNNQKNNLRYANKQLNGINRDKNKNNKLGVKGVHEKDGKYYPKIMKNGKTEYLGTFYSLDSAIKVRKEKEKELFGEFAFKGDEVND